MGPVESLTGAYQTVLLPTLFISQIPQELRFGITRKTNTPSRWIDQGAISALPILEVKTRLESGLIEKALKSFITDKTNWRVMLKNETGPADLVTTKASLLGKVSSLVDDLDAKPSQTMS